MGTELSVVRKLRICPLCFQERATETHHILTRGAYPELKKDPRNLIKIGFKCHKEITNDTKPGRQLAYLVFDLLAHEEDYIIWLLKQNPRPKRFTEWLEEIRKLKAEEKMWRIGVLGGLEFDKYILDAHNIKGSADMLKRARKDYVNFVNAPTRYKDLVNLGYLPHHWSGLMDQQIHAVSGTFGYLVESSSEMPK